VHYREGQGECPSSRIPGILVADEAASTLGRHHNGTNRRLRLVREMDGQQATLPLGKASQMAKPIVRHPKDRD
jgi:hypothetical protein